MNSEAMDDLAKAVAREAMAERIGTHAFPTRRYNDSDTQGFPTVFDPGMSLRAYFAGQAMIALAPQFHMRDVSGDVEVMLAERACSLADALLAALKGGA